MRLATLRSGAGYAPALAVDGMVVALEQADRATTPTSTALSGLDAMGLIAVFAEHESRLRAIAERLPALLAAGSLEPAADARVGPPVPRPGKIIAIGLNYADHARETGQEPPEIPVIFAKFSTSIIAHNVEVIRPRGVEDLDYEAELGVVIGRSARHVRPQNALGHVLGYLNANDISARTEQLATGQWVRGKSFDTFCPIGPYLVTTDEAGDPQEMRVRCWVDGDVRQDSTTAEMIFGVAELISFCSTAFTLEPGDLILTGTPPGVAMGVKPSPWLLPGQRCDVEIGNLGRLSNPIAEEHVAA